MKTVTTNKENKKVLVVDDEAIIREVVQSCLEYLTGWNVKTAQSGQEALKKVMEEKPDGIVLDITMPGMNGLEFIYSLRANNEIEPIPIFLLTSRVEFIKPQQIAAFNLAGGLAKPFDIYELVEQITKAFGWVPAKIPVFIDML